MENNIFIDRFGRKNFPYKLRMAVAADDKIFNRYGINACYRLAHINIVNQSIVNRRVE